jgi:hypothetical protein
MTDIRGNSGGNHGMKSNAEHRRRSDVVRLCDSTALFVFSVNGLGLVNGRGM